VVRALDRSGHLSQHQTLVGIMNKTSPLFICAWCGWLKYLKGTHGICLKHYEIQMAEIAALAPEEPGRGNLLGGNNQ